MKRLCKRFATLLATLAFPFAVAGQEAPVPGGAGGEEEAGVPPVVVRDVKVQSIGEERWLEELPEGLVFLDAATGKLCVADENDPHGRAVCMCREIDWHSFTNTAKFNGHRLELNQFWSQVAEGGSLLYRFGTNSWLRLVGDTSGSLANLAVDSYDPTNGVMVITADATEGAVLQVSTNLVEAEAWKTATNATVTAVTDAATTWSIALLGTQAEFYRVLATIYREPGIHAEKTLYANQGIEMGGVHATNWGDLTNGLDLAVSALDGATNALDGRVGALEASTPYLCRWAGADLSSEKINWVPTNNWPSANVQVFVRPGTMSNLFIGVRGGWQPPEDRILSITVTRGSVGSGVEPGGLMIGTNVVSSFSSSSMRRCYTLRWVASAGVWLLDVGTLTYQADSFDSSGANGNSRLPRDVFLPTTNNSVAPSLAMSPSLSPLSPAVLQPVEELEVDGLGEEAVDELGFEGSGEEAEQER